jgi:hypothetical protein
MTVVLLVEWYDNALDRWITNQAWDNYLGAPINNHVRDLKERYNSKCFSDKTDFSTFLCFESEEGKLAFLMEWS